VNLFEVFESEFVGAERRVMQSLIHESQSSKGRSFGPDGGDFHAVLIGARANAKPISQELVYCVAA
jgi:hypothetical protein